MAETPLAERSLGGGPAGGPGDCHPLSGPGAILPGMGNASAARTDRFPAADAAADSMGQAGPGWYYDPDDVAIYRYWDGQRWTDHRSDTVLSPVPQ